MPLLLSPRLHYRRGSFRMVAAADMATVRRWTATSARHGGGAKTA